jgi:hypothetical protein
MGWWQRQYPGWKFRNIGKYPSYGNDLAGREYEDERRHQRAGDTTLFFILWVMAAVVGLIWFIATHTWTP